MNADHPSRDPKPFIIWTLQRTGGTNLTRHLVELSGLPSTQHEPFNEGRVYGHVTRHWADNRDRTALDDAVNEIVQAGAVIKHCVETVPWEVTESLALASTQAGYRHLFLYRRNALDRLLSLHFAQQTGIWGPNMKQAGKTPGAAKDGADKSVPEEALAQPLPVKKMIHHERNCVALLASTLKLLRAIGAEPMALAYEDLYRPADAEQPLLVLSPVLAGMGLSEGGRLPKAWVDEVIGKGDQGTREAYQLFPGVAALQKGLLEIEPFLPDGTGENVIWRSFSGAHPWILHFQVDVFPAQAITDQSFEVGGLLVLSRAAPDGLALKLSGTGRTIPLDWGQPSQRMVKEHPQGKNARHARWSGRARFAEGERSLAIELVAAGGEVLVLGEIQRNLPEGHGKAHAQPERQMKFESVLVVTYGRTGSTLLMGMLNSVPGVMVRGENMNFCAGLYTAYKALTATKVSTGETAQDSTMAFYGADRFDESAFLEDARGLLMHQLIPDGPKGVRCWGFKEIRYTPGTLRTAGKYELAQYLDFLAKLLPRPAFLFLTRYHEDVAASAFWRKREKAKALAEMETFELDAGKWSAGRADCFWIDYSNLVKRDEKLADLFAFLGAEYDAERLEEVMLREHSFGGRVENIAHVKQRRVTHKIKVQAFCPVGLLEARLEKFPKSIGADTPFVVSGVILTAPGISPVSHLAVEGSEAEPDVQTGMPSPWYQERHPDNPNAGQARFRISGLKINKSCPVTVFCNDESGTRRPVFKFELA